MSTDDNQLAENNNTSTQEAPSLRDELAEGVAKLQESANNDDNPEAQSGQEHEHEEELREQDGGQQGHQRNNEENEISAENRDDGTEVHHGDGSEDDGQHNRQGLQLDGISEDLVSTFEYLPGHVKEHLVNAGYDEETNNNVLQLIKGQNDKYIEKTQEVAELKKVLEPFKDTLAQAGITEAQQVSSYIQWHQGILKDPKEGMIQLANSLGFDLVKLIGGEQSANNQNGQGDDPGSEGFQDPVNQQIGDLNKRFDALDAKEQSKVMADAQTVIDTFKNEKNTDGSLKYPHFEHLKPLLKERVERGMDLQQAYEDAEKVLGLQGVKAPAGGGDGKPEPRKPKQSIKAKKKAASGVKSTQAARTNRATTGSMKDELAAGVKNILSKR